MANTSHFDRMLSKEYPRKNSFALFGAYIWNGLPADVTSAPSLPVFRQRLKTVSVLFHRSYPNIMCYLNFVFPL